MVLLWSHHAVHYCCWLSILRVKLVRTQDVVTVGKTPTAQFAMFVYAERVYGIATAYAFADATQLIQLNSSVQVSEFHEGFDVKL